MRFNGLPPFPATGPEVFTWEQAGGEESRPSVRSARDSEGDPGQNSKLPNRPPGETHRHTDALTVCCECERHPRLTTSHSYKPALCCTFFLVHIFLQHCLKQELPIFFCVCPENISVIFQHIHMRIVLCLMITRYYDCMIIHIHCDHDLYCFSRLSIIICNIFPQIFALSFIGIMPPQALMLKGCQMSRV